ncbi:hypothetical protein MMC12_008599 [Toensbergia leucococca]|nr:hypothetical protein [Toensbergia leucococca]
MALSYVLEFLYRQLFVTPPYPKKDFAGQTIIVTGANTGLGLEAARHFTRLNAEKVILAVRNLDKGETAKQSIEASTKRPNTVEVWQLDLSSYESVKQFVKRIEGLRRLDAVLENAGIFTARYSITEGNESTITTNVISTFLLALLVLPKLRETATKFNVHPRLSIVSSDLHIMAKFPERNAENIFETISSKDTADMPDRYSLSKLLQIFSVRELAHLISESSRPKVIVNCMTPGACHSDVLRESTGIEAAMMTVASFFLARSTEVGSRTLVAGIEGGEETHGQYMADCHVEKPAALVSSDDGAKTQKRVWSELSQKLEAIQPGILQNI